MNKLLLCVSLFTCGVALGMEPAESTKGEILATQTKIVMLFRDSKRLDDAVMRELTSLTCKITPFVNNHDMVNVHEFAQRCGRVKCSSLETILCLFMADLIDRTDIPTRARVDGLTSVLWSVNFFAVWNKMVDVRVPRATEKPLREHLLEAPWYADRAAEDLRYKVGCWLRQYDERADE